MMATMVGQRTTKRNGNHGGGAGMDNNGVGQELPLTGRSTRRCDELHRSAGQQQEQPRRPVRQKTQAPRAGWPSIALSGVARLAKHSVEWCCED